MSDYVRRISASQINLYNKCPRQYYYKYIAKIKEPTSLSLIKGSLVHSVIERFYKLKIKESGITKYNYDTKFLEYAMTVFDMVLTEERCVFGKSCKPFKEELLELCDNSTIAYAKEISESKKIIRNYITLFLMQFEQFLDAKGNIPQAWYSVRPKFSELDLSFENFSGYADSVIESDDGLYIVDYKTSKIYKTGHNEEYRLQVNIYAYAYWKLFGVIPSIGIINFLRYGRECVYEIDKENVVQTIEQLLNDFYEKTELKDITEYPMNVTHKFCVCSMSKNKSKDWCFYKGMCNKEIENGTAIFKTE